MNFPKIGKYFAVKAEYKTGHVLNNDETLHLKETLKDYFTILNSQTDAFEFARETIEKNNKIEITIFNSEGKYVEIFRPKKDLPNLPNLPK